ncbi:hypothetical protein LR48_Vigan02g050200 [Vigna angularis]|uniref:Uncharacterized protein n=1 Tax=Phaseolus angularis TaxID=3914 RepID=A0A0L9TVB0_PHAAN|nr:hypothetical protein LR48_Vigan02g050200 [Vigna angularis]
MKATMNDRRKRRMVKGDDEQPMTAANVVEAMVVEQQGKPIRVRWEVVVHIALRRKKKKSENVRTMLCTSLDKLPYFPPSFQPALCFVSVGVRLSSVGLVFSLQTFSQFAPTPWTRMKIGEGPQSCPLAHHSSPSRLLLLQAAGRDMFILLHSPFQRFTSSCCWMVLFMDASSSSKVMCWLLFAGL